MQPLGHITVPITRNITVQIVKVTNVFQDSALRTIFARTESAFSKAITFVFSVGICILKPFQILFNEHKHTHEEPGGNSCNKFIKKCGKRGKRSESTSLDVGRIQITTYANIVYYFRSDLYMKKSN